MAPKNNSTPIKPLEVSTMTHEDKEWQHDIKITRASATNFTLTKSSKK